MIPTRDAIGLRIHSLVLYESHESVANLASQNSSNRVFIMVNLWPTILWGSPDSGRA